MTILRKSLARRRCLHHHTTQPANAEVSSRVVMLPVARCPPSTSLCMNWARIDFKAPRNWFREEGLSELMPPDAGRATN
jgi:hypothetical protein